MNRKQYSVNMKKEKDRGSFNRMNYHCCPYAEWRFVKVMNVMHMFGIPFIVMFNAMPGIGSEITDQEIQNYIPGKLDDRGCASRNIHVNRQGHEQKYRHRHNIEG